jgi:hypothetical protein
MDMRGFGRSASSPPDYSIDSELSEPFPNQCVKYVTKVCAELDLMVSDILVSLDIQAGVIMD